MHDTSETESIFRYLFNSAARLTAYAYQCKKRGMTYRQCVEELEVWRRDVMKTPDGVLMNPECNEKLDMVRINKAWSDMKTSQAAHLYLKN
ncbi:MAG: hypothetical protein EOO38_00230 [Cytophagaceae bacterium]|nr:MAG: hypothetical protein EOO38_00230 [Cytophagaceae bacterium]